VSNIAKSTGPTWTVWLEKTMLVRRSDLMPQLQYVAAATKDQSLGFVAKARRPEEPEQVGSGFRYRAKILVKKIKGSRSPAIAHEQFLHIRDKVMATAARKHGWSIVDEESMAATPERSQNGHGDLDDLLDPRQQEKPPFVLPPLTDEVRKKYFSDIYARDNHVEIIYASLKAFVEHEELRKNHPSLEYEASHILLYGLPAGAKTKVFMRFMQWLNSPAANGGLGCERVAKIDATTMTKAGLELWLLRRATEKQLPTVIFLEEVEKHQKENLLCLLMVMASGQIQRTNARSDEPPQDCPILIWGTCNDEDELKGFRRGALWSRFTHQEYCTRPDPAQMKRILLDYIRMIPGGRKEWADTILKYSYEECGNDDPRFIKGLLDGRDALSDGSYLKLKRENEKAKQEELQRRGQIEERAMSEAVKILKPHLKKNRKAVLEMLGLAHLLELEQEAEDR
jgi:hypothetical protein